MPCFCFVSVRKVCYTLGMNLRTVQVKASAKINLSLNITGVCGNLHAVDMITASIDMADVITVRERFDGKVTVRYSVSDIAVGSDSVTRAVEALQTRFGVFGADIYVEKNIPLCAGLGGSAADGAAAIRIFDYMYGFFKTEADRSAVAVNVGSDVPYLLRGGFCRVRGTGEETDFFTAPAEFCMVVAQGPGGVLSKAGYRVFDELYEGKCFCPSDNDKLIDALIQNDKTVAYRYMDNALLKPSLSLNFGISETLALLKAAGAKKVLMTGSGSACVGFFTDMDEAEASAESLRRRGFYAKAGCSVLDGIKFI